MVRTYSIKIAILISLVIIAVSLIHIKNINAEKQKEINSEELTKLNGNILSIKIIDHNRIETDAKIFVKKNRTVLEVISQFYDVQITSDGYIESIKDIESNWNVFINDELVDINNYIPSDGDMIIIDNGELQVNN